MGACRRLLRPIRGGRDVAFSPQVPFAESLCPGADPPVNTRHNALSRVLNRDNGCEQDCLGLCRFEVLRRALTEKTTIGLWTSAAVPNTGVVSRRRCSRPLDHRYANQQFVPLPSHTFHIRPMD